MIAQPGGKRFDLFVFEAEIQQGHAFAGRGKQWSLVARSTSA